LTSIWGEACTGWLRKMDGLAWLTRLDAAVQLPPGTGNSQRSTLTQIATITALLLKVIRYEYF
jgi:hypothetical protein